MKFIKKIQNKILPKPGHNKEKQDLVSHDFLFITAFPKSGSSFISLVIKELTNYSLVDLIFSHFREQDLYEPSLKKHRYSPTISKHHTLATAPNVELFQKYKIRPIVLTRNLPDTIVSLRDHVSKTLSWPHFHIPSDFNNWSSVKQYDFLIDLASPWYFHFYCSWRGVELENMLDVKFIRYEDFHTNKVELFKDILDFWNFDFSDERIRESIAKVNSLSKQHNRLNKAIMHRGRINLTKAQIEKLKSFSRYYTEVDFNSIT